MNYPRFGTLSSSILIKLIKIFIWTAILSSNCKLSSSNSSNSSSNSGITAFLKTIELNRATYNRKFNEDLFSLHGILIVNILFNQFSPFAAAASPLFAYFPSRQIFPQSIVVVLEKLFVVAALPSTSGRLITITRERCPECCAGGWKTQRAGSLSEKINQKKKSLASEKI